MSRSTSPTPSTALDYLEHWNGATLVDSVHYTYDPVGNRRQMVDSTGATTYFPDALDRISSITFPGLQTVSYLYDNVGNRRHITYTDSKFVDYTYDEAHNMKTVTGWLAKQTVYTYDNVGNLTKTQLPNGVWTDDTYDNADRQRSVANNKTGSPLSSDLSQMPPKRPIPGASLLTLPEIVSGGADPPLPCFGSEGAESGTIALEKKGHGPLETEGPNHSEIVGLELP